MFESCDGNVLIEDIRVGFLCGSVMLGHFIWFSEHNETALQTGRSSVL